MSFNKLYDSEIVDSSYGEFVAWIYETPEMSSVWEKGVVVRGRIELGVRLLKASMNRSEYGMRRCEQ